MATVSNFALRIPSFLMEDVRALALRDRVSINQLLVSALKARSYLAERAARAGPGELARLLAKAGSAAPIEGDELPKVGP